jgi:peptide chain release factor 1
VFDKLEAVESRFLEVESRLSDPDLANRPDEFRRLSREHSTLGEIVKEFRKYKNLKAELASNKELLEGSDPEFSDMAKEEMRRIEPELAAVTEALQVLLFQKIPTTIRTFFSKFGRVLGGMRLRFS